MWGSVKTSLEVQYLQTVLERGNGLYRPFLSFESSPSAAPSGQYCRDIYDREIEAHEKEFDQHTAQLSSRGMGIDHSHKVRNLSFKFILSCLYLLSRLPSKLQRSRVNLFLQAFLL
jgi:hypothetical protein